ncbi:MAG: 30S ribosomal protein S9 [Phycisphaerae bacterium]
MTEEPTPTPESPSDDSTPPVTPVVTAEVGDKAGSAGSPYIWGTGRRKTAVARVRIRPGEGKFLVNKREVDKYFLLGKDQQAVRTPLEVTETGKLIDVFVNVGGGGISGQSGAVILGLARALAKYNPDHMPKLKEHNLLTRDPRKVERKKYGQRGARRRFQFSKR